MRLKQWILVISIIPFLVACATRSGGGTTEMAADSSWQLSDQQWQQRLTANEFHVLREEGTERAFSGKLWDNKQDGQYLCAACGEELFSSEHKFDSGTGWPSFSQPAVEQKVALRDDSRFGMTRTEVHCRRCGGHLGHVFNDGPEPTGMRYCINGVSLKFSSEDHSPTRDD